MRPAAIAQSPARPLRLVVHVPPGSAGDVIARAIVPTASEVMKRRSSATTGAARRATSQPTSSPKSTPDARRCSRNDRSSGDQPAIYPKIPYEPLRDFAPVTLSAGSTYTVVVTPCGPSRHQGIRRLRDGEAGPAQPGLLRRRDVGASLGGAFNSTVGIKTVHVAYKGATEALTDLIGGRIHVMFASTSSAVPFRAQQQGESARHKGTSATKHCRSYQGSQDRRRRYTRSGLWCAGPGEDAEECHRQLNDGFVTAQKSAEVKQRLSALGLTPSWSPFEQFGERLRVELAKWAKAARAIGAKSR